jgi:apolipoprotein N-acyltransferase
VRFYPKWFEKQLKKHHLFMRSLSTGKDYTIFTFKDARIGVNICYEDVFPEVSRGFALNGANALLTITNDAWYNKTSGSHQHMVHAVFRAVETGRPMLRNGNNSDTCLILPDGSVTDRLVAPDGNPFFRGSKIYKLPLYNGQPNTFYVTNGNVFAWGLATISAAMLLYVAYRVLSARQRILAKLKTDGADE